MVHSTLDAGRVAFKKEDNNFQFRRKSQRTVIFNFDEVPPCPNGCGNAASCRVSGDELKQVQGDRAIQLPRTDRYTQVHIFLCGHCGNSYYLKIRRLPKSEEASLPAPSSHDYGDDAPGRMAA